MLLFHNVANIMNFLDREKGKFRSAPKHHLAKEAGSSAGGAFFPASLARFFARYGFLRVGERLEKGLSFLFTFFFVRHRIIPWALGLLS